MRDKMNFEWAIKQLKKGKKVRRRYWFKNIFIFIEDKEVLVSGPYKRETTFDWHEILTKDWELYKK